MGLKRRLRRSSSRAGAGEPRALTQDTLAAPKEHARALHGNQRSTPDDALIGLGRDHNHIMELKLNVSKAPEVKEPPPLHAKAVDLPTKIEVPVRRRVQTAIDPDLRATPTHHYQRIKEEIESTPYRHIDT